MCLPPRLAPWAATLLLSCSLTGCAPKLKTLGDSLAQGAVAGAQAQLDSAEMERTVTTLTRAATIGAMQGITDDERNVALRGVAEDLVDHLMPRLQAAVHDQLGPELRSQIVGAVHASLLEATSRGNKARIEDLAAGVTGAVVGQLGPELATAIRIDLGPAIGDSLETDLGPALVSLSSQATASAIDQLTAALQGPLRDEIDEVLSLSSKTAEDWRITFIYTAAVLGLIMAGSGLWLRSVYTSLHHIKRKRYNHEAALALIAGVIKNHEGSAEIRSVVESVRDLSRGTPAGDVIREMLAKQPHLKVETSSEAGSP